MADVDHKSLEVNELEHGASGNEKMGAFRADAIAAENAEHSMTVLEAVKAYPMATFWAFVMSFTIVCCLERARKLRELATNTDFR